MKIIKNGTLVTQEGLKKTTLAFENGKIVRIGDIDPKAGDG